MNLLQEKQKEFLEKGTRLTALTEKTSNDLTEDEKKELADLTPAYLALKGEIEGLAAAKSAQEWGRQADWKQIGTALVHDDPEKKTLDVAEFDETAWMGDRQSRAVAEPSYRRDWVQGFRKFFQPDQMGPTLTKALQEGRDDYGGYWTPTEIARDIIRREPHPTEILANVKRLSCGTDKLLYPKFNYTTDDIRSSALTTQWTGELGSTTEDTSLQNQGMLEIPMHEGTLDVQMSRSWMEDQSFNVDAYIREEVGNAYALDMDAHIVSATYGTGVGRPRAILLNVGGTGEPPSTNVGNPVGGDGLFDLFGALPAQYRTNAKFLSNSSTVWADIAQIKAGSNEWVGMVKSWMDNPLGNARVDAILGHPIIYSAFMPAAGSTANILVFGDFNKGYGFVERVGLSAFPYGDQDQAMLRAGLVGVMFRFRVGGRVLNPRALRVGVQS